GYSPTIPSLSRSSIYLYNQCSLVIGILKPASFASLIVTLPVPFVFTLATYSFVFELVGLVGSGFGLVGSVFVKPCDSFTLSGFTLSNLSTTLFPFTVSVY